MEQNQYYGSPAQPVKIEKIKYLTKEIQNTLKKVNAWNSGQLDGLERSQNTLEEELEVIEKALSKTKIDEPVIEQKKEEGDKTKPSKATEEDNEGEDLEDKTYENLHEDFHTWISRSGGHNGGWNSDDHLHMVTLTHRHANWRKIPDRFIEEVWSGRIIVNSFCICL